jgi:hypothetical protein
VIAAAFRLGRHRDRVFVVAVLVAFLIGVFALAVEYAGTGFHFEGRYVLPFWIIVIMAIGQVLADSAFDWSSRASKALIWSVGVCFALVQVLAVFATGKRFAVAALGPSEFWRAPQWSPPAGWWLWLSLAILGGALVLVWTALQVRELRSIAAVTEPALPIVAG